MILHGEGMRLRWRWEVRRDSGDDDRCEGMGGSEARRGGLGDCRRRGASLRRDDSEVTGGSRQQKINGGSNTVYLYILSRCVFVPFAAFFCAVFSACAVSIGPLLHE